MSDRVKGIICAISSAVIFGFTPILARMAFDGGANGITATFLRGSVSIPFLFLVLKYKKIPLSPGKEWKMLLIAGVLGMGMTTLLLYSSYSYISVGMATTIHFTYPIIVTLVCSILFKDRMNGRKTAALILCSLGIAAFMEKLSFEGGRGILLSLLSGVTYALYMLCVDKGRLKEMYYLKLTLYLNVCMSLIAGSWGLYAGELNLSLTPKAWLLCSMVSLFVSFGAAPLLQLGIKWTNASTAAILSTMEPITSVVLGIIFLKESLTPMKWIGSLLILLSIFLITSSESKSSAEGVNV